MTRVSRPVAAAGAMALVLAMFGIAARCGEGNTEQTVEPTTPTAAALAALTTYEAPVTTPTVAPVETQTAGGVVPMSPEPPVTPFPTERPLPTAASAAEPMAFAGSIWVNARPAMGQVNAYINGQLCGSASSELGQRAPFTSFVIQVASDATQTGCGRPGDEVMLTIDGRPFNDRVTWLPGLQESRSGPFLAGPEFSEYYGALLIGSRAVSIEEIVPYVNGIVCGDQLTGGLLFTPGEWSYTVVVDSDALTPGCGRPGVDVALRVRFEGGAEIEIGTLPWEPGHLVRLSPLDVSALLPATPVSTAEVPSQ